MAQDVVPHRILIVDDDPLVCRAVERMFTPRGYQVTCARSAPEAVGVFTAQPYPVVITDLRLPGPDGLSLVEDLIALSPCTAFVMVTSSALVGKGRREGDRSIVSIIPKPWEDEDLYAAVDQARDLHDLRSSRDITPVREQILLLEDHEGDALMVQELLEGSGFAVRWVTRLRDALDVLRREHHPIVLADLALADARGLDCVIQIARASPHSATLVLSGLEDETLAAQAFRWGAEDYLVKGRFGPQELRRAMLFAAERKRAERRVSQLAHTDALTGLANRAAFMDRVRRAVAQARRNRTRLSLLYLDLDGFKGINDSLGHAAGDAVLQAFADRLVRGVRPYDVVARLGGDEFAILLEDVRASADVEHVAQRLVDSMAPPVVIPEGNLNVATSIGIGTFPEGGDTPDALLADADAAMYAAKRSGRNRYCWSPRASRAA